MSRAFYRGEGFHVNSSRTHNSFDQFEEIRVFQTCACARRFNARQAPAWCCRAHALLRNCALASRTHVSFFPSGHAVVASVFISFVHASREVRLLHTTTSWLKSKQRPSIHHIFSLIFLNVLFFLHFFHFLIFEPFLIFYSFLHFCIFFLKELMFF